MSDREKTKAELVAENEELRRRIAAMEAAEKDITGRKRSEETLRESDAKYRRLYESMRDAFVSVTMDGRIQEYNEAYQKMLGYEPDELATHTFWELTPTKWHAFQTEIIERQVIEKGYSDVYEKEYRRKDGTVVPVELRTKLVRDDQGDPCGMWAILRDITERKRAEEALKKAHDELEQRIEERTAELAKANENLDIFRKFAEASGEGFGMSDFDGRIAYVNPTLCRLFGEDKPKDVIGKNVSTYYPQEYVQRRTNELVPALLREGHWHIEQTVLARHGNLIQTLQSTFLIRDESGNPFRIAVVVTDITERKRAEEALRQSRDELQAIYDSMVDGLLIGDCATGRLLRTNPAMCRMLGYSEDELLSMSVKEIHPAEVVPVVLQKFGTQQEGQRLITQNRPMLRKDGTVLYADISNVRISYQGRPCVIGIFRDITERKQAQEALQQAHDELQAIYDGMVDGLLIADAETMRFVRTNSSMCRMLGYSKEELVSMSVKDIHPAEDLPAICEAFEALAQRRIRDISDLRVLRRDGSVFFANISTNNIVYKGRLCVVGFFRDITERKQAQEAITESETKLRTLFEIVPVGISILDEHRHVVDLNPALEQILGMPREGLLRGDYRRRQYLRSDGSPMSPEYYPSVLAMKEGTVVSNMEVGVVTEDGTTVWTSVSAAPLPLSGLGAAVVTRDITEHKQAQDALGREHRTLRHMLQASDHERQLIAYDIHDGLAQYLTGAIMQFQMSEHLREQNAQEAAKAYDGGMALLRQGHSEARRLISGVRPPILDESGVMAAIAHLVHDPAFDQGPKIDFRSRVTFNRLAPVVENVIYRIVQEGLTNARNHSKSKKIVVRLVQRGERLRIEVRDWGIGFDPKKVQENRFGLDGIRERARLLGGKCSIKSKPGEGTAVVVELPVVERKTEG